MKDNKTGQNPSCNRAEFEQIKKLHEVFNFLFEPPAGTGDTEYSTKKREVLYLVELVWPKIEKLCKEFDLPFKIKVWEMGCNPAELNFARKMADMPSIEIDYTVETNAITLDVAKTIIEALELPVGLGVLPTINNQVIHSASMKYSLRKYNDPLGTLKRIFDDVLVRLSMYFNSNSQNNPTGKNKGGKDAYKNAQANLIRLSEELLDGAHKFTGSVTGLDYFLCCNHVQPIIEKIEKYILIHPELQSRAEICELLSPNQSYREFPESLKKAAFMLQKTADDEKPNPIPTGEKRKKTDRELDYESILDVIRHEGISFEATPKTFAKHDEEGLRDIILAHLNGHSKGTATGETFRKGGKTDIRIENKDRSAFVAECKIWSSSKLPKAIDQLLGYLTWRDCNTSIIIFNKDVAGFTGIQQKVSGIFKKHPNYIKTIDVEHKGEWRFEFNSSDDGERKVIIHVFMFNLYVGK